MLLLLLALFTALGVFVLNGQGLTLEGSLLEGIQSFRTPFLDLFWERITRLGNQTTLVAVVAAVAFFLYWKERRSWPFLAGLGLLTWPLNSALKLLFEVNRPDFGFTALHYQTYAFPSGHAMGATVVYGALALFLSELYPRARFLLAAGAVCVALAVAFSRVYLAVHWPSDVLGGVLAGAFLLALTHFLYRHSGRRALAMERGRS